MSHREHYDLIVVGMQHAGLVAAALAAKRGMRVLLLDHGEHAQAYHRLGYELPLSPALLPDLDRAPHVARAIQELGIGPDLRARTQHLQPAFQVVLPGHRLDFASSGDKLLHDLRLEFPALHDAIDGAVQRLFELDQQCHDFLEGLAPTFPAGFFERRRHRKLRQAYPQLFAPFDPAVLLPDVPATHPLRQILVAPLRFWGYLAEPTPTFTAIRLLAAYLRGTVSFESGPAGLAAPLIAACEQAGVTLRRDAVVQSVHLNGRALTGLAIEGERIELTGERFIANTYGSFRELLPGGKPQSLFVEHQAAEAKEGLLTINLVVRREVVPRAMAEAVVLLDGRHTARDGEPADAPLLIRRYPARRSRLLTGQQAQTLADTEHEVLAVAAPAGVDITRRPDPLRRMREAIVHRVARVIPFLDDYLVDASIATDTLQWDNEHSIRRVDPLTLHPFYAIERTDDIVLQAPQTAFRNLWQCGAATLPGLGAEGAFIAGWGVAEMVASEKAH